MTIFMIHGMWATASLWDNYPHLFESQGYNTKAITLLYHGNSKDKLKDIGVMDYVQQAKTEIEKLSDKPIIIGHSMGALIAQKLAEMGFASKLVLMVPSAPRGISVVKPSVFMTFSANVCHILLKKAFLIPFRNAAYGLMNTMSHDEQSEAYRDFVHESGLAASEIARGKIHVDESKVTCPVLVIAGGQDRATPPKVVRKMADKYNALYVEYPGHCHVSLVKGLGWEKIAEDISRWIEK